MSSEFRLSDHRTFAAKNSSFAVAASSRHKMGTEPAASANGAHRLRLDKLVIDIHQFRRRSRQRLEVSLSPRSAITNVVPARTSTQPATPRTSGHSLARWLQRLG